MKSTTPTAGIYGIQDIADYMFPVYVHDHSFVLFSKGKIVNYLQLERFTGIKYDNKLHAAIDNILKLVKLSGSDPVDIIFVDNEIGRAFISKSGKIRFEAPISNELLTNPEKCNCYWFAQKRSVCVKSQTCLYL